MASTSALDRFIAARLHANSTTRHATVLLVGCDAASVAAVANGLAAAAIVDGTALSKPGASLRVSERAVNRASLRATIAAACFSPPAHEADALAAALRLRQHLLAARPADVIVFVGGCAGRIEAEGLVMSAVGTALGGSVWAHAVAVDVGGGEGEEKRRAVVRQAVGEERWNDVRCVVWRAGCTAAADALGDAMAGVVRATAAAFFPPPLPTHATADPPSLDFDDLAMLSDHNIATSAPGCSPPLSASSVPSAPPKPTVPRPHHPSPTAAAAHLAAPLLPPAAPPSAPPPPPLPVPAFASLSLALSASVLSSAAPPLLRPTTRPPSSLSASAPLVRPAPSPLVHLAAVSAARPAVSFQSKSLTPMPVMPACHVAAANGLAAEVSPAQTALGPTKQTTAFPDLMHLGRQAGNTCDPKGAAGAHKTVVLWFRSDLRLHDNEALAAANNDAAAVLPVYCFDPRDYGKSASGFDRTGPHRARFLLQCVAALRASLRVRGSDLVVRVGRPEEVLVRVARAVGAQAVLLQQEVTAEETDVERTVAAQLKEEGVETQTFWGSTLFHLDDLPFALPHMPSNYSGFREAVSRVKVRDMVEAPEHLKPMPVHGNVQPGEIPTLHALGLSANEPPTQSPTMSSLQGGEAEALRKLSGFVAESKAAAAGSKAAPPNSSQYGAGFSCKISPWLAMGCLSPRRVFHHVLQLEGSLAHRLTNKSAVNSRVPGLKTATDTAASAPSMDWLVFELLWRDFFRFITKRYSLGAPSVSVVAA
ncbi:hypothetical protein CLOM_g13765 [Closterium sp. NIES-68]|nr:hypothetical protein CLOM_g13765 [Closterium sp. NIES-68]GJP63635.1 hypothetical protein CLOP_g20701 [Closterium sp. NIES-67]